MDFYERNRLQRPLENKRSPSELLDNRSREDILRNAFWVTRNMRKYRGMNLWSWVGQMTAHGSGYSWEICKELGWDPDMRIYPTTRLPERVTART